VDFTVVELPSLSNVAGLKTAAVSALGLGTRRLGDARLTVFPAADDDGSSAAPRPLLNPLATLASEGIREGTRVGPPLPTGAGPLRLARLGPSVHVLDDLGGTLTVIAPGPPPVSQRAALRLGRDDDEGGNDPQGIAGDATIAGITNSAYGTFVLVNLTGPLHVAASVDLKASPEAPTNFPTAVAYDGAAFFVAIPGLEASTRAVPSEIVRVTWSRP
jgi:hypothetical protein